MESKKFYITAPIYYVNDRPHIGHAYSTIIADTIARFERDFLKKDVRFITGTDENSQKTVEAARKVGKDPKAFADQMAETWQSTWEKLGIGLTTFIRTTDPAHEEVVYEIWRRLQKNGDIYAGEYEGLYCTGCEEFKKESELVNGLCPIHKRKPEVVKEKNWFFKLTNYEDRLKKFYRDNHDFIYPATRFNEMKNFLERGLEDVSISRETKEWGIPVPDDPSQAIYVWFDALISYITAVGEEEWKESEVVHVVGKDIARFHAIMWPAMLMAAKLPLPKKILVNGFFTINSEKISKSLGNAIDPLELKEKYGVDALRYFLLREIPLGEDGDFSYKKFQERYNADLANALGNSASRIMKMAVMNNIQYQYNHHTLDDWKQRDLVFKQYVDRLKTFDIEKAVQWIWAAISSSAYYADYKLKEAENIKNEKLLKIDESIAEPLDIFIQKEMPFKKIKTESERERAIFDINYLLGRLQRIGYMLIPMMPDTSRSILEALKGNKEFEKPLFPRIQ